MRNTIRPQVSEAERLTRQGVVAVIPARGGSKGILRKNIADICGKPLLAYSIEAALCSRLVDRVLVSTDDEEVATVARQYGAWVPWLRPAELGGDRSSLHNVMLHVKQRLIHDGVPFKVCVQLLPTHPFRTPGLLDHLIDKALNGYTAVTTVRRIAQPMNRFFVRSGNGDGRIAPLRTQLHEGGGDWPMMRPYGLASLTAYTRPHRRYFHVIDNPVSLIDIDTPQDLELACEVVRNNRFDFTDTSRPTTAALEPQVARSAAWGKGV